MLNLSINKQKEIGFSKYVVSTLLFFITLLSMPTLAKAENSGICSPRYTYSIVYTYEGEVIGEEGGLVERNTIIEIDPYEMQGYKVKSCERKTLVVSDNLKLNEIVVKCEKIK